VANEECRGPRSLVSLFGLNHRLDIVLSRALIQRLLEPCQVERTVDERYMGECLRKITDQAAGTRIEFLAQHSDVIAQGQQSVEQATGVRQAIFQDVRIDQPEAAGEERAFARRQAISG